MKAPIDWLKKFIDITIPTHDFGEKMTISGSKVEEIIKSGEDISRVFTGQIQSFIPHPDSDHLHICQVNMGRSDLGGILQIVCGAPNVREMMICPVAIEGAHLPGGHVIKKGKLRGVDSNGMCCSIQELGFSPADFAGATEDGLWSMPSDTPVGMDIKEYLGLGSETIDFEITSNRPDCFSIEGLAREAAVTLDVPFHELEPVVTAKSKKSTKDMATVNNLAPELCYRYCARVVENVQIGPSPAWMQKLLTDAGMRPINNVVDITNFVCLELGQPMHAFDLSYLSGHHIIVRKALAKEKTRTLDGVDRELAEDALVIADEEKICAIAGVMGSENSEVTENTVSILFESATFHAFSVRQTAVKNALRTEASSRYEKGLDPENARRALDRACELIEELSCGDVCQDVIDIYPTHLERPKIAFLPARINAFLGTTISDDFMMKTLEKLGCTFVKENMDLFCIPPTYRPDLLVEADLSEEIARFFGYNNIVPTLLSGKETTLGGRSQDQLSIEKMKDVLVAQGFFEAITYSFESPKEMDKLMLDSADPLRNQLVITNPLGEDFSVMRTSMIPSMLRIASLNASRSVKSANIFEIAYVYLPNTDSTKLPEERRMLASVAYDLDSGDEPSLFYKCKGAVTEICANLGIRNVSFEPLSDVSYLHPGRSASVIINGRSCGQIGYIHPCVADRFDAPVGTVVINIEINSILRAASVKRAYTPLPKYPGITRDISVIIDAEIPVGSIEKIIKKKGGKLLESFSLFDIYTGKQIGESKKSIAYNFVFRSAERSLSESDISPIYNDIVSSLEKELGATLR